MGCFVAPTQRDLQLVRFPPDSYVWDEQHPVCFYCAVTVSSLGFLDVK